MTDEEKANFEERAIKLANVLYFYQSQGDTNHALPNDPDSEVDEGDSSATVEGALEASEEQIKKFDLRKILCAYLTTSSSDLTSVTKIVVAVLLPLSLSKQIDLTVTPLVCSAISITIFNGTVKAFCSEYDQKSTQ